MEQLNTYSKKKDELAFHDGFPSPRGPHISLIVFWWLHFLVTKQLRIASFWESFKSEERILDLISAESILQAVQFQAPY